LNAGKEFEFAVCRLLQQMGFEATITGYSQDGGVDLVATSPAPITGGRCVVQCKAWTAPIGEPILRDLFGTMHAQGANKGILITTSSFTAAALRFAQGKPLELIDGDQYRELCQRFGIIEYDDAIAGIESLPIEDPRQVRLLSVTCTDRHEAGDLQAHTFTTGILTIAQGLEYWYPSAESPTRGGFPFSHVYFREVAHEMSAAGRLDLTFRIHPTDSPVYTMAFEGRTEVTEPLHQAALARMRAPRPHSLGSGCVVLLALPVTVALLWKTIASAT
jgi:hypothetical protein